MSKDAIQPVKFTRRGNSIVPPTAEQLALAGMATAIAHAERVIDPLWADQAYFLFAAHARGNAEFTTEDVREYAGKLGFADAPDRRAWGGIVRVAMARGLIEPSGRWIKANDRLVHGREVKVWRSLAYRAAP